MRWLPPEGTPSLLYVSPVQHLDLKCGPPRHHQQVEQRLQPPDSFQEDAVHLNLPHSVEGRPHWQFRMATVRGTAIAKGCTKEHWAACTTFVTAEHVFNSSMLHGKAVYTVA